MGAIVYPDNLAEIGRFPDEATAHDYGLVILSAGAGYWIHTEESGEVLLIVEAGYAGRLREQLELYELESVNWPPQEPEMPEPHPGAYAAMTWVAVLVLAWLCQLRWPMLVEWGTASSDLIKSGELYRTFSALFLHGDIGHLAGNLLFGAVFLHLVARHIGTVRAWLGVLMAGACGNYLNATVHFSTSHYSIGASTAVFGAIGLLVALPLGFGIRHSSRMLIRAWALPIIAGLVFLAWFGTGSDRTDTSAHLMGFVCGLPAGLIAGALVRDKPRKAR
ncbi:rhomboid family intramembrane serine protease [Puniceicoccales bacterium CK1056]|uniref:Rhomboid family intramembrane serine protease n=1 Tax=Oceanipulchritudo coccoides TaxID=2706888 RepID=A0A6B2M5Y6_9BACT|nr:rhomboid family intramembrane serine protease [Oceanipulchritudo coccoides]NDV63557.1 rhomboid family intramembrane serine protease [Oceanipulchritudo coccoides]